MKPGRIRGAGLRRGLGLLLAACAASACQRESAEPAPLASGPAAPDRLGPGESLPEAETAFGLPLPPGMRLVRQFKGAAYFAGKVKLQSALEHLTAHIAPRDAQLVSNGAVFPRVRVTGDASGRLLRVEVKQTPRGSQIHVEEITQQPALSGLSQEEIWRRAGRKPDGTPLDPNQLY